MLGLRLRSVIVVCLAVAAAGTAGAAPLPTLSDEFGDPATAAQWQVMQGDLADGIAPAYDIAKTTPGELTITPGRSWWVDGSRAFYLYKPVQGDVVVTTRLHVTGRDSATPTADWSLSGLLVRRPTENRGQESWVSLRVGRRGGKDFFERKTTVAGNLDAGAHAGPARLGRAADARVGRYFVLLRRYPGRSWTTHFTYVRRDLPLALMAGIDAFSDYGDTKADLVSHVDWIHFAPTGVPGPLRRAVLAGKRSPAVLTRYLTRG